DQRIAHGEGLREAHQRVVDGLVAMRVELAHHLADDGSAFGKALAGIEARKAHGMDDAAMHRLQPVADIRQRAVHDGRQRISEIALLERLLQVDRLDIVVFAAIGREHALSHESGLAEPAIRGKAGERQDVSFAFSPVLTSSAAGARCSRIAIRAMRAVRRLSGVLIMRLTRLAVPAAVSGLLTLALCVPLHAQANQALLDRFQSAMAAEGTRIEWTGVSTYDNADGKPVTALDGVTIDTGDKPVAVAKIELVSPEQTEDGYMIEEVIMPDWQYADGETRASISDLALEGVVLTKEGVENAYGTSILYDNARLGEVRVSPKEAEIFTLTVLNVAVDIPADRGEMTFDGAAEGFTFALSKLDNPSTRAAAAAMGYDTIEGSSQFDGSWSSARARRALTRFDINGTDAGTLGLKLDLGGYTPAFMKSLRQKQEQLAAAPESAGNSGAGLAM